MTRARRSISQHTCGLQSMRGVIFIVVALVSFIITGGFLEGKSWARLLELAFAALDALYEIPNPPRGSIIDHHRGYKDILPYSTGSYRVVRPNSGINEDPINLDRPLLQPFFKFVALSTSLRVILILFITQLNLVPFQDTV